MAPARALLLALAAALGPRAAALEGPAARVGEALKVGLGAEAAAAGLFAAGDTATGVAALADGVLAAAAAWEPELQSLPEYKKFERLFRIAQRALPAVLAVDVGALQRTGDAGHFADALGTALRRFAEVAAEALPAPHDEHVAALLNGLGDAAEGVGESVELAEEGHQLQALRAFAEGMHAAVNALLPPGSQSEEDFLAIVREAQPEAAAMVGSLVSIVEELVDSAVCWRRSATRERALPASGGKCEAGAEAWGRWCYSPCPAGYEKARGHCRQSCGGAYPAGARLLCGKTDAAVAVATMEILAQAVNAATTGVGLAELAKNAGLAIAGSIPTVLDAFAELAKPFGHPKCPENATAVAP